MAELSPRLLRDLHRTMLRIRLVEERIAEVYPEQEIRSPCHLYIGEEAIATGVSLALGPDDYTCGTYRGHGLYLARGGDLRAMMAELYGRATGCAGGRGGSMHMVAPEHGLLGCSAIVGSTIPMAVGAALAATILRNGRVAACFFGDGAADEGVLYESLNFAALKKLPALFVCENNFYATNSPQRLRHAKDNVHERAEAFGVRGVRLDGNDVVAVHEAAHEAVERARRGGGPTLLECRTYRWKEHVGPNVDVAGFRSRAELDEWLARDPIAAFEARLLADGVATTADLDQLRTKIADEIDDAFAYGKASPLPEPETLLAGVYAER